VRFYELVPEKRSTTLERLRDVDLTYMSIFMSKLRSDFKTTKYVMFLFHQDKIIYNFSHLIIMNDNKTSGEIDNRNFKRFRFFVGMHY
jgi:hypothetical protein